MSHSHPRTVKGPCPLPPLVGVLTDLGVPVIVCRPNPAYQYDQAAPELVIPKNWHRITAAEAAATHHTYRPGIDTLALVTGHGVDGVDLDTKIPGVTLADIPTDFEVFGKHRTPSGGEHWLVRSTGYAKGQLYFGGRHVGDYLGGTAEGGGRALLFLPGSSRPKYPGLGYVPLEGGFDPEKAMDSAPSEVLSGYLAIAGLRRDGGPQHPPTTTTALTEWLRDLPPAKNCWHGRAELARITADPPGTGGRHYWLVKKLPTVIALVNRGCLPADALQTAAAPALTGAHCKNNAQGVFAWGHGQVVAENLPPCDHGEEPYRLEIPGHSPEETIEAELAAETTAELNFGRHDLGNANRFKAAAAGRLLWHETFGWLHWDGRRWVTGATHAAEELTHEIGDHILAEADAMARIGVAEKEVRRHRNFAHQTKNGGRMDRALKHAAVLVRCDPSVFDAAPDVLNVANGVVDLRTGELTPHKPEGYHTRIAAAPYHPTAECPTFMRVLTDAHPDPVMRAHLQRLAGYALTGRTGEQQFWVMHGAGANGKSTLWNALYRVLGDYAVAIDPAALGRRQGTGASPERAALRGRRFVICNEPNYLTLDPAFLKTFTGGDVITSRELYKAPLSFNAVGKLHILCNDPPTIDDNSDGMWRRARLIEWGVTIPPEKRTHEHVMTQALDREAAGILRWAVEGAIAWYRDGLGEPASVTATTEQYRQSQDTVLTFLSETGYRLTGDPGDSVPRPEVTEQWRVWGRENRKAARSVGGTQRLGEVLRTRYGVRQGRTNKGYLWYGICRDLPQEASDTFEPKVTIPIPSLESTHGKKSNPIGGLQTNDETVTLGAETVTPAVPEPPPAPLQLRLSRACPQCQTPVPSGHVLCPPCYRKPRDP